MTCRSCRAPIEFAIVLKSGKRIPLDVGSPTADQKPNVIFASHENIDGLRVVEIVAPGAGTRISHFATCPAAARFRTRKPKAASA